MAPPRSPSSAPRRPSPATDRARDPAVTAAPDRASSSALSSLRRQGERALAGLAGFALLAMMLITFIDVIGRYVFSAPLAGAFEMTEIVMGVLTFAILPAVTARGENITVGIFEAAFHGVIGRVRNTLVAVVSMFFVGLMTWRLWIEAANHAAYNDRTTQLHIPVAPFVYYMAAMAAVVFCVLAAIAWRASRGGAAPGPSGL